MVRVEKPLPIRLEDTVCLEEGRAPGPNLLAVVLKDTAGTSGASRFHVQEQGIRGGAGEHGAAQETHGWSMHSPDRLEGWPAGQPEGSLAGPSLPHTNRGDRRKAEHWLPQGTYTSPTWGPPHPRRHWHQTRTWWTTERLVMPPHWDPWAITEGGGWPPPYSRARWTSSPPSIVFRAPASTTWGEEKEIESEMSLRL